MGNVRTLLREAGAGMESICKITIYTTDTDAQTAVTPVLEKHLGGIDLASTHVVVKSLARTEMDVVVDVFAVVS